MYDNVIDVIKGKAESVSCTLETARNFVLASNLAFESSKLTHKIDDKFIGNVINLDGTQSIYIKDINELIHKAVKDKKLFSECGVSWGVSTSPFYSDNYKTFSL